MKAVDQRYYQGPLTPMGDCFQAAIASIFDLALDEVPHFVERERLHGTPDRQIMNEVWTKCRSWAWDYGLALNYKRYGRYYRKPRNYHPGYWIASVAGCEQIPGSVHAVVMWGDQVSHDPNPLSRLYFKTHPYRFHGEWWFEAGNPGALVAALAAR